MNDQGKKTKTIKFPIILSVIISLLIIFLILYFTVDITTFDYLSNANIRYEFFIIALILQILSWFIWGARLKVLSSEIEKNFKISLWESTKIIIANLFLAGITPSMAGGGATCALVGYDSGESSFQMIVNPAPNMEIRTKGSSHYMGDIYIDIETNWVKKATLDEFVITEVNLPMPPNKVNAVVERDILIRNVTAGEFKSQ